MTQLALVIDLNVCVGCHACVTSCKQWNTSGEAGYLSDDNPYGADPTGTFFNRVQTFEVGEFPHTETPGGTVPIGRGFSLIGKPLGETTAKMLYGRINVIHVIAVLLPGQQCVAGVMDVIVPLGGIITGLVVCGPGEVAGTIMVVFQHQVDTSLSSWAALHCLGDFFKDVRF